MRTRLAVLDLAAMAADARLDGASIVVEELTPAGDVRDAAVLRPHAALYPASMIKVPIALGLAALCARGRRSLADEATVAAADMTANDAPSPFRAGALARLDALSTAMIAASDNVATNVLITTLGRATLTAEAAALGLPHTAIRRKLSGGVPLVDDPDATGRNAHPAADAAAAFRSLARDASGARAHVATALAAQHWNDKLSRGLESGDRFAHKTGDTDEVSHDGGLLALADGRRFVVVVYTALPATPQTDPRFGAFMRALRRHLALPSTGPSSPLE